MDGVVVLIVFAVIVFTPLLWLRLLLRLLRLRPGR